MLTFSLITLELLTSQWTAKFQFLFYSNFCCCSYSCLFCSCSTCCSCICFYCSSCNSCCCHSRCSCSFSIFFSLSTFQTEQKSCCSENFFCFLSKIFFFRPSFFRERSFVRWVVGGRKVVAAETSRLEM